MSIAKLVGANKEYIEKQIPHLSSLLCDTIEEVIDGSEVIVVGNQSPEFAGALAKTPRESDRHRSRAPADLGRAAAGRLSRHLLVMRTLLICHDGADLDREGLARWLGSFSEYVGTVVIREPKAGLKKRIAREIARVGAWRFLDVLAFRAYYALARSASDRAWERRELARLRRIVSAAPEPHPRIVVASPNSAEAESFIRRRQPDLVIARCKMLLAERIFSIPRLGTFVMHPGICPEYRNAHGCFWAMAAGDADNVGVTLLRIDKGVDTGPVFGYYRVDADPMESHVVTQHRAVLEHLEAIRDTLRAVEAGTAAPIDTTGRSVGRMGPTMADRADQNANLQPGSRQERKIEGRGF